MTRIKKMMLLMCAAWLIFAGFTGDGPQPFALPNNPQQPGNAADGYQYLVTGDYLKSGIPYQIFKFTNGKARENYLQRTGINAGIPYNFTAIKAPNGQKVVAPNCLQCHAQEFEGELYVGLGNTFIDFTVPATAPKLANRLLTSLLSTSRKNYDASINLLKSTRALAGKLTTRVRGVNAADHLAEVLAAHRHPETLQWSDEPLMPISPEVIPTDVPAWWLLKKKKAMFYTGFGRGNFARFLMASNLLTVADTSEAREVYTHFDDVLAFLYTLRPPAFPKPIDKMLATKGKALFNDHCSKCHGKYGADESYPNLLIPAEIIKTDSALYAANYSQPAVINWFNRSWFTQGTRPAQLVPYKGYIAPPLDGVWITAPYLHNGSVPTLEGVLNSKARPAFWRRNFNQPQYNYSQVGWQYETLPKPARNAYNTRLKGYGNYGHYFGDKLNDAERQAVIEYLKTL